MVKIIFLLYYSKIFAKDIEFMTYAKLIKTPKNVDVKNVKESKYMETNRKQKKIY